MSPGLALEALDRSHEVEQVAASATGPADLLGDQEAQPEARADDSD